MYCNVMHISYFVKFFDKLMDYENLWLLMMNTAYKARPMDLWEQGCWPQM
jgi:hypothetical protein